MDVFCTVPYYAAELCLGLRRQGAEAVPGLTTYYQDRDHFRSRGLRPDPGILDVVGRMGRLPAPLRRPLKFAEALINLTALAIRFTLRRPDIIHVQYLALVPLGLPFEQWLLRYARHRGSRIVYTVHDLLPHDTGLKHKEQFRSVYEESDALVCHTSDMKSRLVAEFGIDPDRIWTIPHGPLFTELRELPKPEARRRMGLPENAPVVLWQGIVKPYKGVPFLLDAWREVLRSNGSAILVIAGTGEVSLLDAIRTQVSSSGIESNVRLLFRYLSEEELAACYSAADLLVYPYREITTSGALMTGLMRHQPIVATRLPAFLDVLEDRRNARLITWGDTDALAAVLVELLSDPAQRTALADGARATMAEFPNWDSIARTTLDGYRRLLSVRAEPNS